MCFLWGLTSHVSPSEGLKDPMLILQGPSTQTRRAHHCTCLAICHAQKLRRLPLPDPRCNHYQNKPLLQPHWQLLETSSASVFGSVQIIFVITLEADKKRDKTKIHKIQKFIKNIKPFVPKQPFAQMCKVITNKHFHVSIRCCVEPN